MRLLRWAMPYFANVSALHLGLRLPVSRPGPSYMHICVPRVLRDPIDAGRARTQADQTVALAHAPIARTPRPLTAIFISASAPDAPSSPAATPIPLTPTY